MDPAHAPRADRRMAALIVLNCEEGGSVLIKGYHHVSITVSDLDRSIAFYRDLFGFILTGTAEAVGEELSAALNVEQAALRLAVLEQGAMILELIEYRAPEGRKAIAPRPCDVGCMHMALAVDNIHELYEELSARGVRFNTPPQRNSEDVAWVWWCYLQDPDGVPIELVQKEA